MGRLDYINGPEDIKRISSGEWDALAAEIRRFLISHCSACGGHLASNLGVVELTMAMYLSFCPPDSAQCEIRKRRISDASAPHSAAGIRRMSAGPLI